MLDVTKTFESKGYLVTLDIEKALDHTFLLRPLEKLGFETNFIDWIKIFLNDQKFCVINGSVTTQYFKLKKDVQQSDPISMCLFILCLETLFTNAKNNEDVKSLNIL